MKKLFVTPTMGLALKTLRLARGYKASDLISSIGKTVSYISKLEKSEIKTINPDCFLALLEAMSKSAEEYQEAIIFLLNFTTNDTAEFEEWKLYLDYFHRTLRVPSFYQSYIQEKMSEANISSDDIHQYLNENKIISSLNDLPLSVSPTINNSCLLLDDYTYVITVDLTLDIINDILYTPLYKSCYAYIFAIHYAIYKIQGATNQSAYTQTTVLLDDIGIIFYHESREIDFKKNNGRFSSRLRIEVPSKQLSDLLTNFAQPIVDFHETNAAYTNDKLRSINNLLKSDPVLALKLLGTDLTPLINKPTSVKKEFFAEVDELIKKYSKKDVSDEIELL